jgi:uncharacterized protein (TIGR03437 family)
VSDGWFRVTPSSMVAPATLSVSVLPTTSYVAPGTYGDNYILLNSSAFPLYQITIPVSRTILPPGALNVIPASLDFTYQIGSPIPAQTLQVTGPGALSTVSYNASLTDPANWLSVSPATGTTPAALTLSISTAGLSPGVYTAQIAITSSLSGVTGVRVPVKLTVQGTSQPTISAVTNAASFASGPVVVGEMITIWGTALGPAEPLGLALDSAGKVATQLGGVSISVNGYAAPLAYVSQTQINCVVPYEAAAITNPWVQVKNDRGTSNAFPLKFAPTAPGVFTLDGSGAGIAAALNTAGCPGAATSCANSASTPAPQGSTVVLFVTGEGETNPVGVTGTVTVVDSTPGNPLTPIPKAPLTVSIGGQPASVVFYGEAPGMVAGILQINVQVPMGLAPGNVPVVVSLGEGRSQAGLLLAVQ